MITDDPVDFRHRMGCDTCWARKNEIGNTWCLLGLDDKNRPESVDPSVKRTDLFVVSGYKDNYAWICEFRYLKDEVRAMKAGDLETAHVSAEVAEKILKAMKSIPGFRI